MTFQPLATQHRRTEYTVPDIRLRSVTGYCRRIHPYYTDVVQQSSLLHKRQIDIQFGVTTRYLQRLIGYCPAVRKKNMPEPLFRAILFYYFQRIHLL